MSAYGHMQYLTNINNFLLKNSTSIGLHVFVNTLLKSYEFTIKHATHKIVNHLTFEMWTDVGSKPCWVLS